ncbi:FAD-binding oxidoreductase [Maribacter litopenaei]|uniref:FAD-binding oxidoreductase n=1 Tax=Maribacter litopenaei TaxID=2976127 RepID=UPI0030840F47
MADFYALNVKNIKKLTPNSVAVTFEIPKELVQTFLFTAGQYITIKKEIKGKELRRAYSISSSPKKDSHHHWHQKSRQWRIFAFCQYQTSSW